MELPPWASFVLAAALFLSAATTLLLLQRRSGQRAAYKRYRLPPGPRPWPVIGNLHLMGALPHRSIRDLSARYGPLMQLRFGSFPVVVGSSPEMAKLLLQTHDAALAGRPRTAAGRHTAYDHSDMLWSSYGAHWRRLRRVCLAELFSAARIASYESVRHDEVRALLRGLHATAAATAGLEGGAVVVVREHLFAATLGMISRMVLGRKYVEAAGSSSSASGIITPEEFTRTMDEFFFLNGALNIGDFVPWLDGLDLQGYVGRMRRVGATLDAFMERVLDEHVDRRRRADGEGHASPCMVDVLLELADGDRLERDSVKALTLDLIAGGTNTNGVTLEWAISELVRNPKILARATEELDCVVGPDRLVTERDVSDLPYVKAIVKETMRMHPVGPLLAPHEALEDVSIGGYDIPAGTRVLVNVWAIARDDAMWDTPEEFRPERFLSESKVDVAGKDFELLPFGSGRRMCPGYNLGLKVVHICVANILHCFTWSLPDGMAAEKLSMDEIFGLTTSRKIPLEVFIKPKLSSQLYAG